MRKLFISVMFLLVVPTFVKAQSCNLNATPSNFSSQLAAATPGQTLCLATGDYGTFNGVAKSSPGVTITAASGATPTMAIFFGNTPPVAWITLDGITISGGLFGGAINNVTIRNSTFVDKIEVWGIGPNNHCGACVNMNNSNLLFDNDLFNMAANQSGNGGFEGRIQLADGGPTPQGITIQNSKFTTGCADGLQISGPNAGYGVTIKNNEFFNIVQGNCNAHVDSIQFVGTGAIGPVIDGNYFHDDTDGIVSFDYANDAIITNNVFVRVATAQLGGISSPTSVLSHNTVVGASIGCGVTHEGDVCHSAIINNIADGVTLTGGGTGAPIQNDYNLCSGGCVGSHSLTGSPSYVGGSNPTTYAGFALTNTSRGRTAGNDGKDIGINLSNTASNQPAPPTGLIISVR